MTVSTKIYKSGSNTIDLIISLTAEQILEIITNAPVRPKRGRPLSLSEVMMLELYKDIDAGECTKILAERYNLSISSVNRIKRYRKKMIQEASNATSKEAT